MADVDPDISPADSLDEVRRKVGDWLTATLPPSRSDSKNDRAQQWWITYHRAGLATPTWPEQYGGLGVSEAAAGVINSEVVSRQAPVPYNLVTVHMVGSVIMAWGSDEQKSRMLEPLAARREVWCQLFSEPGAGSDLASLSTRARRSDDGWVVNGQKVWCSFAAEAARGLLLARTDVDVAKQQGITAFALDMKSPGVTIRPLHQMTGDATFCEVFLDDVVVPDTDRIGETNCGWAVAGTMLSAERNMLGGGGASAVARVGGVDIETVLSWLPAASESLRRDVLEAVVTDRVVGLLGARLRDDVKFAPAVKLMQGQHNQHLQALAVRVYGPRSIAHVDGDEEAHAVAWGFLRSRANSIGGGTSELMRTLIGERILGLPREPDPYRGKPWLDIPRS